MHPCLVTPEIQQKIFEYASSGPRRFIISLALTCQGFKETALDILWRDQASIAPLIKTMSARGDLWDLLPSSEGIDRLILLRQICEQDWERFDYYATRIHNFTFFDDPAVSKDVFGALGSYRPARVLFPKVRWLYLELSGETSDILFFVPALLHNSLNTLDLRHVWQSEVMTPQQFTSILQSLQRLCPFIENLHFRSDDMDSEFEPALETFILNLAHLRTLECPSLRATPRLISHLKNLRGFSAWNRCYANGPLGFMMRSKAHDFSSLRMLSIESSPIKQTISLLDMINAPLEELTVNIMIMDKVATTQEIGELCSVAAGFTGITYLSIRQLPESEAMVPLDPSSNVLDIVLLHLSTLKRLESIILCLPDMSGLTNATLHKIIAIWPQLRCLSVQVWWPNVILHPETTLEELGTLVESCHFLESVSLAVNCRPFTITPSRQPSSQRITTVCLHPGSLLLPKHVHWVVRCLSHMFPMATCVAGPYDGGRQWEEFNSLSLPFFTIYEGYGI